MSLSVLNLNPNPNPKETAMKKLMTTTTLVLFITGICHASTPADPNDPALAKYFFTIPTYDGPSEITYWTGTPFHAVPINTITLGKLARYSDVIGVGTVSNREDTHFTVTVDHALAGCTNGAIIMVHENPAYFEFGQGDINDYKPTNNNQIVFAVYTNYYYRERMYWNSPEIPVKPLKVYSDYQLILLSRSWWPVERDDGVLFTQFTNIIQAVRVDHNWTNYYHLVRDGLTSTSNRVQEDSHWDMSTLVYYSTYAQRPILLADPLLDSAFKDLLINEPDYGFPDLEEP